MSTTTVKEPHVAYRLPERKITPIPPLENGDVLSREEFERRYNAMPHVKKAELIEGRVYMSAAAVRRSHGKAHGDMMTLLGNYCAATPGIEMVDNTTVRLDKPNEPQPDVALRIIPETLGRSRVSDDDYIEGPPELVAEVSGSSASLDLHGKLETYRRNGVQEYLVWQIYENRLDWFELVDGTYEPLLPDDDGLIRSRVFPGLWLDVDSLLSGDMAAVLETLQLGVKTDEHAEFVKKLHEQGA